MKDISDFFKKNNYINKEFIFFTEEHHSLMLTSFKIIKSNLLFGTGGKSFSFLCGKDDHLKQLPIPTMILVMKI